MAVVSIVLVPGLDEPTRRAAAARVAASLGDRAVVPTFGATDDADLARFLQAEVADDDAPDVVARLAALAGVDGAYVKPADAAP